MTLLGVGQDGRWLLCWSRARLLCWLVLCVLTRGPPLSSTQRRFALGL